MDYSCLVFLYIFNKNHKNAQITYSLANIKLNICQIFFLDLKSQKDNVLIFLIILFANCANVLNFSNK
jgi:hypothetical protein